MSKKHTLNEMVELARRRGGQCLSAAYINNQTHLDWQCRHGHRWSAKASHILNGSWCPYCAGRHKTIQDMKFVARSRGGYCVSNEYLGAHVNLEWRCANGHIWPATPSNLMRGTWCPKCWGKNPSIADLQRLAINRGGQCLTDNYVDSRSMVTWVCANGHKFRKGWSQVKGGSWCQKCFHFKSEEICRTFMEEIYKAQFPKKRPIWLKTDKGGYLELDGFCVEKKIAFEYQGEQHYKVSFFSPTKKSLERRCATDKTKLSKCIERGVELVIFPEIPSGLRESEIIDFLYEQLKKSGVSLPSKSNNPVSLGKGYRGKELQRLNDTAKEKGGECLSPAYLGMSSKHEFVCINGHKFSARASNILRGVWCAYCAERVPHGIEKLQKFASSKGGRLLSDEYLGANSKLQWSCHCGHVWFANPGSVIAGSWCPKCANVARLTIEDMHKVAIANGGECLSKIYINNRSNLKWRCKNGHEWIATYGNIKSGHWCHECGGSRKRTLDELEELVSKKGGRLISDQYINSMTAVEVECAAGHRWMIRPMNLKRHWCPICARNTPRSTKRLSIDQMQEIAKSRDGRCLSKVYQSQLSPLDWECSVGHQWSDCAKNIKRGRWCPVCSKEQ